MLNLLRADLYRLRLGSPRRSVAWRLALAGTLIVTATNWPMIVTALLWRSSQGAYLSSWYGERLLHDIPASDYLGSMLLRGARLSAIALAGVMWLAWSDMRCGHIAAISSSRRGRQSGWCGMSPNHARLRVLARGRDRGHPHQAVRRSDQHTGGKERQISMRTRRIGGA